METVKQAEIDAIIASMNRSVDTLSHASRSDTVEGAKRNITNCENWLKQRKVAFHFNQGVQKYELVPETK